MARQRDRGSRVAWLAAVVIVTAGCTTSSPRVEATNLSPTVDGGGSVELAFTSPTEVDVGRERELARWTVVNRSTKPVAVWAGVAIDGLPDDCSLDDVYRWDEIRSLIEAGTPPDDTRYNLDPVLDSSQPGVTAMRRDISENCAGDYELVLMAVSPALTDGFAQARAPLTIGA